MDLGLGPSSPHTRALSLHGIASQHSPSPPVPAGAWPVLLPLDTEEDGFRASQTGQQEPSVYSPAEAAGYVAVFSQRPVRGSGCESTL